MIQKYLIVQYNQETACEFINIHIRQSRRFYLGRTDLIKAEDLPKDFPVCELKNIKTKYCLICQNPEYILDMHYANRINETENKETILSSPFGSLFVIIFLMILLLLTMIIYC